MISTKTKKMQKIKNNHYYHKSTKSVNQNTFNAKEFQKNRKFSSPKKKKTPSAYAYSNQKIDPNFKEPEGILFYRHSERRETEVRKIIINSI
jgi:hypothetical protein